MVAYRSFLDLQISKKIAASCNLRIRKAGIDVPAFPSSPSDGMVIIQRARLPLLIGNPLQFAEPKPISKYYFSIHRKPTANLPRSFIIKAFTISLFILTFDKVFYFWWIPVQALIHPEIQPMRHDRSFDLYSSLMPWICLRVPQPLPP